MRDCWSETMIDDISKRRRNTARLLLPLAAVLALGACAQRYDPQSIPTDGYRSQYPISLTEAPETLDIAVGYGGTMTEATRDSVMAFAADARSRGTSGLVILSPQGAANDTAAAYVAQLAHRAAIDGGLAPHLIEERRYAVGDNSAAAPVRLSYSRIRAVTPPCGQWTDDINSGDYDNNSGLNFGCSTQANLAAMVSNPQDLIHPRASTPPPVRNRVDLLTGSVGGAAATGAN
jgi:pilus assembly protein CpaD